jgi:predicted nucleotidyltransferase
MLKKYNRYKILKVFLFNPTEKFGLRELSRLSKISPKSVMNYLKEFEKEKLIKIEELKGAKAYSLMVDRQEVKNYTKMAIQFELEDSDLVDYLWDNFSPEAIILYGSFARGEITDESDIDIFLLGVDVINAKIDIDSYEKKLDREIQIMGEKTLKEVPSKEFKNNLINGVVLRGYLKIL